MKKKIHTTAYKTLFDHLGPSSWWPARTPFEVIIGAILTQNTSWKNVEKAIAALKEKKLLSAGQLSSMSVEELGPIIRSSGYYNQKAKKVLLFLEWYKKYNYSPAAVKRKFSNDYHSLREELLCVHGVGRETADSILCYAFELPFFVVDAYTFRWLSRYSPAHYFEKYDDLRLTVENEFQAVFESDITKHYNEYHALLVRLGNGICTKRNPACHSCCLSLTCKKNIAESN